MGGSPLSPVDDECEELRPPGGLSGHPLGHTGLVRVSISVLNAMSISNLRRELS